MSEYKDLPGPSHAISDSDVAKERRARREIRKQQRGEEKLKKKIAEIRVPGTQKISLISKETYQKLQDDEVQVKLVKNKHFKASKSEFALIDFVVNKSKQVKEHRKRIHGTTVKSLRPGKVREIPKKKCLSKLKRAILEIREKRKDEASKAEKEEQELEPVAAIPPKEPEVSPEPLITYSRRFRSYCDHLNHPDLKTHAEKLLQDLFRFQDRAYDKNPIKAQAHRRYVVGFKEVERYLEGNKVKLLLIASDLEPNPGPGGLDEAVARLKDKCKEESVPYCFPLLRRKMGYLLLKKAPISCVGILDFDGAEDSVKALLKIVKKSRRVVLEREMERLEIKG